MKKTLLLLVLLCSALWWSGLSSLWAGPIDPYLAKEHAVAFMQKKGMLPPQVKGTSIRHIVMPTAVQPFSHTILFNAPDKGFVIVSGDDRTEPILGYSTTGHIDPEHLPENMKSWLQQYDVAIQSLPETMPSISVSASVDRPWSQRNWKPIAPLLKTTWNQNEPYNNKTLKMGDKMSPTGCVATAMAQIMNFHHHPQQVLQEIPSYTNETSLDGTSFQLPAVSAGTPLDWAHMRDSYYQGKYSKKEADAVATLMSVCGRSVEMDYGLWSSAAYDKNVEIALKTYFGYQKNLTLINRENYLIEDWEKLLYEELQAHRPVYYSGGTPSENGIPGGAHAFVCDGYDGDNYFHINWGWGGSSNGYFKLTVLNPYSTSGIGASSSSDGYCVRQQMIVGVQPGESTRVEKPYMKGYCDHVTVHNKHWYELAFRIQCFQDEDYTAERTLGIVNQDGQVVPFPTSSIRSSTIKKQHNSYIYTFTDYFPTSIAADALADGTYPVVMLYRPQGTDSWKTATTELDGLSLTKTNSDLQLHLRERPVSEVASLQLQSFAFKRTPILQDTPIELQATFKNVGDKEFHGNLEFIAIRKETPKNTIKVSNKTLTIQSGSAETTSFYFTPNSSGTYKGYWTMGETKIDSCQFEVEAEKLTKELANKISIVNPYRSQIKENEIRFPLVLKNDNDKRVYFKLKLYGGLSSLPSCPPLQSYYITIDAHSTYSLPIELGKREKGGYVFLSFIYPLEKEPSWRHRLRDTWITFEQADFVQYWNKQGKAFRMEWNPQERFEIADEATAVQLPSVAMKYLKNIVPNQHQNTIYYWSGTPDETKVGLQNLVINDTARHIVLVDGEDAYFPQNFFAKKAEFVTRFAAAPHGLAQKEIFYLPFEVQNFTDAQGQSIARLSAAAPSSGILLKNIATIDQQQVQVEEVPTDASLTSSVPFVATVSSDYVGQPIHFCADNTLFKCRNFAYRLNRDYQLYGTLQAEDNDNHYRLNAPCNTFISAATPQVAPFRAVLRCQDAERKAVTLPLIEAGYSLKPTHYEVEFHENKGQYWSTGYFDQNVAIPEGTWAYWAEVEGDYLQLHHLRQVIPAYVPVVLQSVAPQQVFSLAETQTALPKPEGNVLSGTIFDQQLGRQHFYLGKWQGTVGFYHWNGILKAYHAYLDNSQVPLDMLENGMKFLVDEVTGIALPTQDKRALPLYDLQGRRVSHPVSGQLYIRGGRKIIW